MLTSTSSTKALSKASSITSSYLRRDNSSLLSSLLSTSAGAGVSLATFLAAFFSLAATFFIGALRFFEAVGVAFSASVGALVDYTT